MRISLCYPDWIHQTFHRSGKVGTLTYDNCPDESSDYVVTFGNLPDPLPSWWSAIPRARRIAVLPENPKIYWPKKNYFDQHEFVITPAAWNQDELSNKWIFTHAGNQWFYGVKYRTDTGLSHVPIIENPPPDLSWHIERHAPKKTKLLSVVFSGKNGLIGHQLRQSLIPALRSKFSDRDIDIYGFGNRPITDKAQAIDSYHYHLVIENDFLGNYVTEKICDAYLGFAEPIYIGAPNIQNFFDEEVMSIIPVSVDQCVFEIEKIVSRPPNLKNVSLNRFNVLLKLNFYYHLSRIIENDM
jgi:hypothetical protein